MLKYIKFTYDMQCIMFVCYAHSSNIITLNIYMFGIYVQVPEKCISKSG